MARKKPVQLTKAELRLMKILWQKGSATVSEAVAALPKDLGLAYNTVLTTLRILEAKGYVRHSKSKDARAFVYRPAVGRLEATRNAVRQLLGGFFGDSPEALVLNLLEDDALSEEELRRIRQVLERKEGDSE